MSEHRGTIEINPDRRNARRRDTLDGALTLVKGQSDAILCVVKNISQAGARIVLQDETSFVPQQFKLSVPGQDIMADCEQVWRKGREIGLKFRSLAHIG